MTRRLMVIGLDAAPPRLLYQELARELPTLSGLIAESQRYDMKTCHPPITIPAWAVMFTGKTPGELGLYGFRHKRPDSYNYYIANSASIRKPLLWDTLGKKGLRSIVVGVPPSYPPKPVRGYLVSCFITPSPDKPYTWPPTLKKEIEGLVGEYVFDVVYRSEDKDRIIRELWGMTRKHFQVLRYLAKTKKWDIFVFVEIGTDRVQHAFWKYYDPQHPRYPGDDNKYKNVIPEYYKLVDRELEKLLQTTPKDTVLVVVSDHGAKAMKGAYALNQWLIQEGYLKLREEPGKPGTDLTPEIVDWEHTRAWAWGGYYARVFINLEGREPRGSVKKHEYDSLVEELRQAIRDIKGPDNKPWDNQVYTPWDLYPEVNGDPPDLMVYLDNLDWRAAGTIGWPTPYLEENDRGPDDAVHDWHGILTIHDPEDTLEKKHMGIKNIHEIRGALLELIGVTI